MTKPVRKRERRNVAAASKASSHLPAIGMEAEFATVVDGEQQTPEEVFGSPRHFIRGPLSHRTGRSYHLPTGGAIYFDTGVMELATPMIEISRGCGARGTRSLWESLAFLRGELDGWEEETGRSVRLVGFSTHYNVSFDAGVRPPNSRGDVKDCAYLLTHILAAPVMMLAANRRSTGIGVRPRGNRIEVTADFTPDAALMAATATLIIGIVREVMRWPSYSLDQLDAHGVPVIRDFVPIPHSSRKGWVAKYSCFPRNPFTSDVDGNHWHTRSGDVLSLREIAGRTTRRFWKSIREIADPTSLELIGAVMHGRVESLLELDDRPAAYEDAGRLCAWNDLFPLTRLTRSRYERVVFNAIHGGSLRIAGNWHRSVGMQGWTHVVFRRVKDGARRVLSLDQLLDHLGSWGRSTNRRVAERRATAHAAHVAERRSAQRRSAAAMHLTVSDDSQADVFDATADKRARRRVDGTPALADAPPANEELSPSRQVPAPRSDFEDEVRPR